MSKIVLALLALCAMGARSAEYEKTEEDIKAIKECAEANQVDVELIETMWKTKMYPADEHNVDCFNLCLYKKLGILTSEGDYDEGVSRERMLKVFEAEKVEEIITKCRNSEKASRCEIAGEMAKCYLKFLD